MSRSYKHTPGWTDGGTPYRKWAKRQANKIVRKAKVVHNGSAYKKLYCSYDICDYKFIYYSKKEILAEINRYNYHPLYRYYMK